MFENVTIYNHPLIQHKLAILRDKNTSSKDFCDLVSEIAMLMCYEATRDLPTVEVDVETPMGIAKANKLAGKKLAIVPILRAGLGMVDGIRSLIPAARVGHIGLYRDEETLQPVEYYCKLPKDIEERDLRDTTRKESPLVQAADAVVLDNSDMTLEEQFEWLKRKFDETVGK